MSEPQIISRDPVATAVVRGKERMEDLPAFYDRAYPAIAGALAEQGINASDAFGLYGAMADGVAEIEIGFVVDSPVEPSGDVVPSQLPGGEYATLTHVGSYAGLGASWEALGGWIKEQGRTSGQTVFEVYRDNPVEADPDALRTELYWSLT